MNSNQFHAIVLGSGPAGCAASLTLKKNSLRVAMIDTLEKPSSIAIAESVPSDSRSLLRQLGINENILDQSHIPAYETISLWDSHHPISKNSMLNPYGHGWHVDKHKFNQQLRERCDKLDIPQLRSSCYDIKHEKGDKWEILCSTLTGNTNYRANFLVDCTGRRRELMRRLGVPVRKHDALIAVNASFAVESHSPASAVIETVENGWWYSSSLPGNIRTASFFTNPKSIDFKMATKYENFRSAISRTVLLGSVLNGADLDKPHSLTVRYANSERVDGFYGSDWICAGDAAATFDPLSSQGIDTALVRGCAAADAITQYLASGNDASLKKFAFDYEVMFDDYLDKRNDYYRRVKKWPESAFWSASLNQSKYRTT